MADPFQIQQERVASDPRQQWGWGPSPLASNEEMDAWRVAAGQQPRDIRNDPAYRAWAYNEGGYPKSRRTIRMQEEWQKQQMQQLQLEAAQQAQRDANQLFEFGQRDQFMQETDWRRSQDEAIANQKIQAQAKLDAANIISVINQLNPASENFEEEVAKAMANNPLGTTDEGVQKIVSQYNSAAQVYKSAATARQQLALKEAEKEEATRKELARVASVAARSGMEVNNFVKTEGGVKVIDYVALGRAEGNLKAKDEKPTIGGRTQQDIESIITSIEADIAESEGIGDETKSEGLKRKLEYYKRLMPTINSSNVPKFNSKEEADAANLKVGTIVDINGERARITK